jgi:hypothetical protein
VMNARVTGDPAAPRKLNPNLTPAVEEITLHALERDPKLRYQTATAMREELDNYERVEITHRDQRLRAPQPWKSNRHMAILVTAGVLGWILLFYLLFLFLRSRH